MKAPGYLYFTISASFPLMRMKIKLDDHSLTGGAMHGIIDSIKIYLTTNLLATFPCKAPNVCMLQWNESCEQPLTFLCVVPCIKLRREFSQR